MIKKTFKELFNTFEISHLDDENFKEDSVREIIILPILLNLEYSQDNIIRSKTLQIGRAHV